ncbi:MAG: TlpA disulfide reductase family protein [Granulosicoccus sp.]
MSDAIAFELQQLDAKRVNLNDYLVSDRWTLVMFWSTDCIPCEQQKPMIEAFHADHEEQDATVVGVALDGMKEISEIEKLVERHNPTYPNLVVFTDVFNDQYRELTGKDFFATPTYLLYAPDGALVGVKTGLLTRDDLEQTIASR